MRLVALCLLVGCSYKPGFAGGDDEPGDGSNTTDGMSADGSITDAACSFSTQFDTCDIAPTLALDPTDALYNTDTHLISDLAGNNAEPLGADVQRDVIGKSGVINVLTVTQFTLAGGRTFRVIGSKPFGIVSTGNITIDGTLSATSSSEQPGAGARDLSLCGASTPQGAGNHSGGAAGGGGGAFQGDGGKGQDADSNDPGGNGSTGAAGGIGQTLPPGPLGGCPGGFSGSDNGAGGQAVPGGPGGGAIYLLAQGTVEVKGAGKVTAGGAGGNGGDAIDGGGAGGGSGGMILLEGAIVKVGGLLAANGGGGGGGSGGSSGGGGGMPGGASETAAAAGGDGFGSSGGDGGTGSIGATLKGGTNTGPRPAGAGGGGGGGAGVISIKTATSMIAGGAKFSPPLVDLP